MPRTEKPRGASMPTAAEVGIPATPPPPSTAANGGPCDSVSHTLGQERVLEWIFDCLNGHCQELCRPQIPHLTLLECLYSICSVSIRGHTGSDGAIGGILADIFRLLAAPAAQSAVLRRKKAWLGLGDLGESPSADGPGKGRLCSVRLGRQRQYPLTSLEQQLV